MNENICRQTMILLFFLYVSVSLAGETTSEGSLSDRQMISMNALTHDIMMTIPMTHFAALRPNKQSNGGWGNLLWHFVEIQGMALATRKRAVFNHAVVNALFNHPDAINNQSFDLLSNDDLHIEWKNAERNVYKYLWPCKSVKKQSFASFGKIIYIHGCFGGNLLHAEAFPVLARALHLTEFIGTTNSLGYYPQFPALVYSSLFSWIYSNPTPLFKRLANERTALIRRLCYDQHQKTEGVLKKAIRTIFGRTSSSSSSINPYDTSAPLDLVIQIRTFRDTPKNQGKDDFFTQNDQILGSFRQCALQGAIAAVQRIIKYNAAIAGHDGSSVNIKHRQHYHHQPQSQKHSLYRDVDVPICVYVTSDSTVVADAVRDHLIEHIHTHLRSQQSNDGSNGGGVFNSKGGGNGGSAGSGGGGGSGGRFISVVSSSDLTRLSPPPTPYTKTSSVPSSSSASSSSTSSTYSTATSSLSETQSQRANKVSLRSVNEPWHSMESMKRFQSKVTNQSILAERPELLDWMILSEATSAVFTAESTFGGSARARRGYFGARWDYHVIHIGKDKDKGVDHGPEGDSNVLQCQLVNPSLEICESCKKLKDMCPMDVVAECQVLD